jgi:hypothetical protein
MDCGADVSLTDCSTVTSKKLPFGVNTTIELKNIRKASNNNGTPLSQNILRSMPLLSDVDVIFLRSVLVLTAKWAIFRMCHCCTE